MRITINRMRGSLAHKVGSGQAVFRPDEVFARHTPPKLLPTSKAGPFAPGLSFWRGIPERNAQNIASGGNCGYIGP
jgi:hypothetical protein